MKAALALLALAACATPTPPLEAVAALGIDAPAAAQPGRFGATGRYRVLHGSTSCESRGGNPMVWPDRSAPPTVGRPTRVEWTTNPTAPYRDGYAYLLVSLGDAPPIDLTPFGFTGCTLWVTTARGKLFSVAPKPGSRLTREGGTFELNWTPPPAFAGVEVRYQLVVASPDNAPGWILSPGLEAWIGSGD